MSIDDQKLANNDDHEHEVKPPPQSFGSNVKEVEFGAFDHSSIPLEEEEWPVLIVGSSMVGMMTGLLLGYHGYGPQQGRAGNASDRDIALKVFLLTGTRLPVRTPGLRG